MSPRIEKTPFSCDSLLLTTTLTTGQIDKNTMTAVQRLRDLVDQLSPASLCHKRITMLCNAVDLRISKALCNPYPQVSTPLAVFSGAGIAGLAASLVLRARGFRVLIVEKRDSFSRFNIISLGIETQVFLKKFNLLEKFETFVAARIKEHRYALIEKSGSVRSLGISDVHDLHLDKPPSFEPEDFDKLFNQDGIYSVSIGALQEFLAESALEAGVNILGNASVTVLSRTRAGGVSEVQVTVDRILQPDLFFIAEGSHSTTAPQLGMKTKTVVYIDPEKTVMSVCNGENWVFGNMTYPGKETFVISVIDASESNLRIANVIFNAKRHVINIAVTSDEKADQESIRQQILQTAEQVFNQEAFPLEQMDSTLLTTVAKPVHVTNRITVPFSMGNAFCIGDTVGSSSPLAGLGGTRGLTLVPRTVDQLVDDYEQQSSRIHENFSKFSEAYTFRWIHKSEDIKRSCIKTFNEERSSTKGGQDGN